MITKLYANNFRCLVAFKTEFDSFGVLCGPNGSGKSSVFDALRLIRNLGTGEGVLGGDRDHDVPHLEFTNWLKSDIQEFELGVTSNGRNFEYVIHIQQSTDSETPRIVKERAKCDERTLFDRDLKGVSFKRKDGTEAGFFPLDWRQAALAAIQPEGYLSELAELQQVISRLLIVRPNPRAMERESKSESRRPDLYFSALTSWYRSLQQDFEWARALHELLREVWPDFKSIKLVDVGLNTKALQLRFGGANGGNLSELFFSQLSDGEKALIALYMVRAAIETGAVQTVFIDEPDNYVGLPELQPWVLSMRELLDDQHQAILISHHPEILSSAGEVNGRYLWRDNHTSPTRIGPLTIPEGLTPGEAIARGWVRA
jgi:energy-coupling factor transporter ATP-binding protein EcfA2